MKVEKLLAKLSQGELSNLSMSNDGDGTIKENKRNQLIDYINDGLTRLHGRFLLKEKELILRMIVGVTHYHFLKKYADSVCEPECGIVPYIIDTADPFQEDLIKVLKVTNQSGREHPLNDSENKYSVFTPSPGMLQIPVVHAGNHKSVLYQANHRKLEYGVMQADIELPVVLFPALQSFVASQVFSHMNGTDHQAKSVEHLNKFNGICMEVAEQDLVSQSISQTSSKFDKRGFI